MLFEAVLSNKQHPEYGVATVPFPIPKEEYDHVIALLILLEIGDAVRRDCKVDEIRGDWPVLRQLEQTDVNVDELDYLAKRIDSFDQYEKTQFQGMAAKLGLHDIGKFIDLTFCCQESTVITDFSDLEHLGKRHFMTMNGGGAVTAELEKLDGRSLAVELIDGNIGYVTPFGVVYPNDIELRQVYDGHSFPPYWYDDFAIEVEIAGNSAPAAAGRQTWLYLPRSQNAIERALLRAGINRFEEMHLIRMQGDIPDCLNERIDLASASLDRLNELAHTLGTIDDAALANLEAAAAFAKPQGCEQLNRLAENVELFSFAAGALTPYEYGEYLIQKSGRYAYDEQLKEFYDYERIGRTQMEQERWDFTDDGCVSYHGAVSMEELLTGSESERRELQRGGME